MTGSAGPRGGPGDTLEPNRYSVAVSNADDAWSVDILDPSGQPVWSRSCSTEGEARTFASTVEQHVYWLSPAKFRDYYRIPEQA